jgi:sulfoxide reductase heme-binding subunit YedZ
MERAIRYGVFCLCLVPFVVLIYWVATDGLGPDPAEALMHITGEWSLRLLLLTLLVSPLRAWTGWSLLLKLRRLVYPAVLLACLHLLWQARSDIGEALVYLGVAAILLSWRLRRRHLRQGKATAVGAQ